MEFKDWVTNNSDFGQWIVEFLDVAKMSTDGVDLIKKDNSDSFDEYEANDSCRDSISYDFDRSSYMDGIYDNPEEDPNFEEEYGVTNPEFWLEDNPEPDEEEEPEDHEKWQEEWQQVNDDYESAQSDWRDDMEKKKEKAEEDIDSAIDEYVSDCVDEARREWERENTSSSEAEVNFEVDGEEFTVSFEKGTKYLGSFTLDNVWDITFKGPQGYSTTGKNKNATLIYRNLLLSVKKLLETEEVNGISFSAAEPAMALVYNQFYKQFLSKDFIRVETFTFVKRSIAKEVMDGKRGDFAKGQLKRSMLSSSRNTREKLKSIKSEKLKMRQILQSPPIGKMFVIEYSSGIYNAQTNSYTDGFVPMIITGAVQKYGRVLYTVLKFYTMDDNRRVNPIPKSHGGDLDFQKLEIEPNELEINSPALQSPLTDNVVKNAILTALRTKKPEEFKKIANYV
jgi:hypothetical protein